MQPTSSALPPGHGDLQSGRLSRSPSPSQPPPISPVLGIRGNARLLLFGALTFLLLFVLFTVLTKEFGSEQLDHRSQRFAERVAGGVLHSLFAFIEPFGSPVISSFLALVLAGVVAARRSVAAGVAVIAALGVLTVIEGLLRVRLDALPWDQLGAFLEHPRGWHLVHSGYPSGHTARLSLLAVIAACTLTSRRPALWVVVVVTITFWISVQRVEAGRHSGTDVIGGALLGWGLGLAYAAAAPWVAGIDRGLGLRPRTSRPE